MENPCKIIFFGDSITRDYFPFIEKRLNEQYQEIDKTLINEGIGGETSTDGLKRLNEVINQKPTVIVIGFGMNDWRKGVKLVDFKKNITQLIDLCQKANIRTIISTINPNCEGRRKRINPAIYQYNSTIRKIALEKRIKVADIFKFWMRTFKPYHKGLKDDIHPNDKGYQLIAECLMHVVPQSHTTILWQYNGRESTCNYKCGYCYYAWSPKATNFFWGQPEDWRRVFKESFGQQNLVFYFAFGEPTLGEAFYNVVQMFEKEPKWRLRITSNISQPMHRLMDSQLVKEKRLYINASFHPTQVDRETFLKQLLFLRDHGIEAPVIYVMWPPHLKRFEEDFKLFNEHNFLVHVRRFRGKFQGKTYPDAYTEEERQFIAKYADDATIKYMMNEKPIFNRRSYAGYHFYIVDPSGNIGLDSDCFAMGSANRTRFGNIIQNNLLQMSTEPQEYPVEHIPGTVDGDANFVELNYKQLEDNNVLSFSKQGGVYHTPDGVHYKNFNKDFNDPILRAEYYFPSRNLKEELAKIKYYGIKDYQKYGIKRFKKMMRLKITANQDKFINRLILRIRQGKVNEDPVYT